MWGLEKGSDWPKVACIEEAKLQLKGALQPPNLIILSSMFTAQKSRILFWVATLVRATWPCWEMLLHPSNISIGSSLLWWQVSALFWPRGEWQLSLSKSLGQKSDLGIWGICHCSIITGLVLSLPLPQLLWCSQGSCSSLTHLELGGLQSPHLNHKGGYGFMISCSNTWSSSAVGHVLASHMGGGSVADHTHWLIVQLCRSHLVRQSNSRKFLPSNESSLRLSTLPVKQNCSSI